MKLTQLAAKPQLIEIVIDDADIVEQYGDAIVFYTWDRQPLEIFSKLASATGTDTAALIHIVRTLILDEAGEQVLKDDVMLPSPVLVRVIARVVDALGK